MSIQQAKKMKPDAYKYVSSKEYKMWYMESVEEDFDYFESADSLAKLAGLK